MWNNYGVVFDILSQLQNRLMYKYVNLNSDVFYTSVELYLFSMKYPIRKIKQAIFIAAPSKPLNVIIYDMIG